MGKPSEGYDSQDLDYLNKIKNDEKNKDKKIREGIIRFYGDKNWAFLVGHRTKKKEGAIRRRYEICTYCRHAF